jgi:manganese/zinc/iron transport system permease protein
MIILMSTIFVVVLLLYKEFKLLIFDQDFLRSSGFPAKTIDLILMGLIVLTIMTGLQAVGVILVAAMLITPAAAARFWTNRLGTMLFLAVVFGIFTGISGTYISATASKIPTGPVLVLAITIIFLISAVLAPKRGIIARWRKHKQNQIRENIQHILRAYYEINEQKTKSDTISFELITRHLRMPLPRTRVIIKKMQKKGLLTINGDQILLTEKGKAESLFVIKSHRLWEHYLLFRSVLNEDHVHQPADDIEHIITPEILNKLEELLQKQGINVDNVINQNLAST